MTPATPARRRAPLAFAVAAALLPLAVLVGCDDHNTDAAVVAGAKAAALRAAGTTGAEPAADADPKVKKNAEDYASAVKDVAGFANGSRPDAVTIQSKIDLARLKLDEAHRQALEVAAMRTKADGLALQALALSTRAGGDAQLAVSYRGLDPKKSIEALNASAAAARGDGNAQQFAVDVPGASIPSLAAAQQAKSQLDGQIAEAESKRDAATKQRDEQLAKAGDLSAKADQAADAKARVDLVTQAADARRQAAEASRQLAAVESSLMKLRADAGVQAALQQQLAAAVESLGAQSRALESGWAETKSKSAKLTDLAKSSLAGNEKGTTTVKSLAEEIGKLSGSIRDDADKADATYKEAIAAFDSASQLAGKLVADVAGAKSAAGGTPSEAAAWDAELKVYAADTINVEKGLAQLEEANFLADNAAFAARLQQASGPIASTAKSVGVAAPEPFDAAKRKDDLAKAVKEADEAFDAADATLQGVTGGDAALHSLQTTGRVLGMWSHGRLAMLAKAGGVEPDVAKKAELVKTAREAATEAQTNGNVIFPVLPTDVAPSAPSAPATAPAAKPAPAEGDTPAAPAAPSEAPAGQ